MKNGVFWVVTPCGSCKNRRFGGTKIGELGTTQAATRRRRRQVPQKRRFLQEPHGVTTQKTPFFKETRRLIAKQGEPDSARKTLPCLPDVKTHARLHSTSLKEKQRQYQLPYKMYSLNPLVQSKMGKY
jgi:hypothetical protein